MDKKITHAKTRVKKKRRLVIFFVEIIILLIALSGLFVYLKMGRINSDQSIKKENLIQNELSEDTLAKLDEFTTIALFGLDNRENGNFKYGNSDVIMIASINNRTKKVNLVSVYRDTYLNMSNSENTYNKANAAYNAGGPQQAISMLNKNLDLDITDFVSFDFNAVAKSIDLLGGVEIEVNAVEAAAMKGFIEEVAEMTDKKANYLNGAGTYVLDGVQATAYARVRQTAGDDFKRTERQRTVISKMVEKALDSDISTINKMANELFEDIYTSFSSTEMLALAKDAFSYSLGDTQGFPQQKSSAVMKLPNIKSSQDCVIPTDLSYNVELLHKFLFSSEDYKVTQSVKNISEEIVNLTGKSMADAVN